MPSVTACLTAHQGAPDLWRWDFDNGARPVDVYSAPERCADRLRRLNRLSRTLTTPLGTEARRSEVVGFLDELWHELVSPIVRSLGDSDTVRFRLPRRYVQLPVASACDRSTGESLVHLVEPVTWCGDNNAPFDSNADRTVVRIDGHFRQVARRLVRADIPAGSAVLLMGCRTAELVPLLRDSGAGAVVVSSWDVEDRDCERFGNELEQLLVRHGFTAASAVRSVQAGWSWRDPHEWAGYSAVGFQETA